MNEEGNEIKKGRYRHFKGKEYEVIGVAHHSDDLALMVVYRGLYDSPELGPNPLMVRPLEDFLEKVTLPDGREVQRFEYIGG